MKRGGPRHPKTKPVTRNGVRYRSTSEARWAIVFEALGLDYEYEPEGFDLGSTGYLPDFYVADIRAFVEIKPAWAAISASDRRKLNEFCRVLPAGVGLWVIAGTLPSRYPIHSPQTRFVRDGEYHDGLQLVPRDQDGVELGWPSRTSTCSWIDGAYRLARAFRSWDPETDRMTSLLGDVLERALEGD